MVAAQAAVALTCTSFSVPGSDSLAEAHTGTRPGDTMGGLLHGFLHARVVKKVEQRLQHEELLPQIGMFPLTLQWVRTSLAVRNECLRRSTVFLILNKLVTALRLLDIATHCTLNAVISLNISTEKYFHSLNTTD